MYFIIYLSPCMIATNWQNGNFFILAGLLIGSVVAGFMSDRLGRIKWIRISYFMGSIFGVLMALSTTYTGHVVAWSFISGTSISTWVCIFVYTSETVKSDFRAIAGQYLGILFGVGIMAGVGISLLFPNWRHLVLAYSFIAFLDLILSFCIHESPRWLWTRKRYEEASEIIRSAAKFSGTPLSDETEEILNNLSKKGVRKESFVKTCISDVKRIFNFDETNATDTKEVSTQASKRQYSVIDIFKYRRLAVRMILLALHWVCVNCLYYGVLFGASLFKQNVHIYALLQGFGSFLGCIIGAILLRFLGRKPIVLSCLFFVGTTFSVLIFVPQSWKYVILFFAFSGKVCLQIFFQLCYQWTADLMPTVVRTSGLGFGSMMARATGLAIPYVGLLSTFWVPLPLLFYSLFAFSVMIGTFFLPETRGKRLANTMEEGNVFCTKYEKGPTIETDHVLKL